MRFRTIDAAQGKVPCDCVIRNATYLDVFSCRWRVGDLSIVDGILVGVEPGLKGKTEYDVKGKFVVPGFIDAHVHVESSCLIPTQFEKAVLPRGTTTAICDPHELTNVMGLAALDYFLAESAGLTLDLRVMLSSCVPATAFETNGGGTITADDLLPFRAHPKALGLAEMMNVPGVLNQDPEVMQKILAFQDKVIDGHCPLLSGQALSAYAVAGISSCHESTQLAEAEEKLSKGIAVWLREGSVAKDLRKLAPLLTLSTSSSLGFCTDDRNPLDIQEEGHLDYLLRLAIESGVEPEVAFRAASWTVARHYGLGRVGAIAPGYRADLVVLDDKSTVAVRRVMKSGKWADQAELGKSTGVSAGHFANSLDFHLPEAAAFEGPKGLVHVIGVDEGKILTRHEVMGSTEMGVARLSVVERYGWGSPPANAYVQGFGSEFKGAIASSVGHDSHNVIVAGSNAPAMRAAVASLKEVGGGFAVVQGETVLARLALPFGGLMTSAPAPEVARELKALRAASLAVGCALKEPFLQLAFLSLPVIPALKLTDQGLFDVARWQRIRVEAT